jgi:hypothetical protein
MTYEFNMGIRMTRTEAKKFLGIDTPRKAAPDVRVKSRGHWSIKLELGCRVVSEANRPNEHWSVRHKRKEIQSQAFWAALIGSGLNGHTVPLPVKVTWIHVGKKFMDTSDNLNISFKKLRDELARWLAVDDADPRVEWIYGQRLGEPGVEVVIESGK